MGGGCERLGAFVENGLLYSHHITGWGRIIALSRLAKLAHILYSLAKEV